MPRPRSVSEEVALERALLLFWERGYDRTSIADLSAAIGVGPSSIYNAFGSKEAIFRKALDVYMGSHAGFAGGIFEAGAERSAGESIGALLRGATTLYTTKGLPNGCAMFQAGGAGSPVDSAANAITLKLKQGLELSIRDLLESRVKAGDELAGTPRMLSKFIVATMRGLSQLASDGATRQELMQVADHAAKGCVSG